MVLADVMPTIEQKTESFCSQRTCDIIRTAIFTFNVQINEKKLKEMFKWLFPDDN